MAQWRLQVSKKPPESLDNKKQAVILSVDRALARQPKIYGTQDNSYESTFNPVM
jgi:hypothetical protein